MQCSLCGAPGTTFTKAVHPRHGTVYLCEACRALDERDLRPADRPCTCDPDSAMRH
jgi:hypothetical protein